MKSSTTLTVDLTLTMELFPSEKINGAEEKSKTYPTKKVNLAGSWMTDQKSERCK